jgi:hypothetical protein
VVSCESCTFGCPLHSSSATQLAVEGRSGIVSRGTSPQARGCRLIARSSPRPA